MAFGRKQGIRAAQNRAAAQPLLPNAGKEFASYLTPEPSSGGGGGAQRLFGANSPQAHANARRLNEGGQQAPAAAPPAYGTGKGSTASQRLNKAGPDFSSGGNPFAKMAESQGVQRNAAPQGTPSQGRPAPSYGAGKGQGGKTMSPRTGTQRKALPNMQAKAAPMGGSSGQI